MLKIAHLSDLHFSKVELNPFKLLSKRFIGIINLLVNRRKVYRENQLNQLPNLLKTLGLDYIFVSGDITSTSLKEEFERAKELLKSFDEKQLFVLPGNHDKYTKKACRQNRFYDFFEVKNTHLSKNLKDERIEAYPLSDKWYYIGLDTCLATSLFACSGMFSKDLERHLIELLDKIPKDKNIILMNHFPIIHAAKNRKILHRRDALKNILKRYPNIKLFLHGHTHNLAVYKEDDTPHMLCSGCSSHSKNGSFNILEIEDDKCKIITYRWDRTNWIKQKEDIVVFDEKRSLV